MLHRKDMKLAFIITTNLLLLLAGCQALVTLSGKDTQSDQEMRLITEHIRVDDEVIDKGDPYTIIEPVWWSGNIYEGETEYNKSLAEFSKEQRLIFAVIWYMSEVNNGGHDQFYYNSTGIVWKDALTGFEEMGVDEAVEILEESAKRLGGKPNLDRETRWAQMDTYHPAFDDLDDRFYDLENRVDLDTIMRDYIIKNREAFYYEGDIQKPEP
ncbi:MAG: DUF4375 domain-containing protein [Anaerolineae bacterium]|nr:DUF4375 domain-containing protein [Anaerolineae bacterium]